MLFRTRHVEDAARKIVETAEEENEDEDEDEDDDGIEDQFVSLWLDVEDESSAVGGEGEVVWRVVGRGSCCESKREREMQRGVHYKPTFCYVRNAAETAASAQSLRADLEHPMREMLLLQRLRKYS